MPRGLSGNITRAPAQGFTRRDVFGKRGVQVPVTGLFAPPRLGAPRAAVKGIAPDCVVIRSGAPGRLPCRCQPGILTP